MATVVALISSVLALAGVAHGAWLGSRNQADQWRRDTQLQACQRLMDQFAFLYDSLAQSRREVIPDLVVDAAHYIDETF